MEDCITANERHRYKNTADNIVKAYEKKTNILDMQKKCMNSTGR